MDDIIGHWVESMPLSLNSGASTVVPSRSCGRGVHSQADTNLGHPLIASAVKPTSF
ncbi:hypothetical protein [Coleofasciculus sp. G2-EDA-02]|uniref:hypothetical protein n=1 Tax=Coleofasciculus sp. G2-EDA-02 TaxID=3069529 RepID=UPI0032FB846A